MGRLFLYKYEKPKKPEEKTQKPKTKQYSRNKTPKNLRKINKKKNNPQTTLSHCLKTCFSMKN